MPGDCRARRSALKRLFIETPLHLSFWVRAHGAETPEPRALAGRSRDLKQVERHLFATRGVEFAKFLRSQRRRARQPSFERFVASLPRDLIILREPDTFRQRRQWLCLAAPDASNLV